MKVDVQQVVQMLSAQIGDLAVRLAVAEARADNAERSLVDALAEQEAEDADS